MNRFIIIIFSIFLCSCASFVPGYYQVVDKDIQIEVVTTYNKTIEKPVYLLYVDYDSHNHHRKVHTTYARWMSVNIGDWIYID